MEWYLRVVRDNYSNFQGRARRQEYWMFVLFNIIFTMGGILVLGGIAAALKAPAILFIIYIYMFAIFIPSIAVVVRRLHDVGKSGWYYFVALIPLVGGIWLLVLLATEGDKGANEYGPDPKSANNEEISKIGKPSID